MINNSNLSYIRQKNSIINSHTNCYQNFQKYLVSAQNFESFQSYDK